MRALRFIVIFCGIRMLVLLLAMSCITPISSVFASGKHRQSFDFTEGTVSKAIITAGSFDLHRKYRSMEGPYVSFSFKIGDVVASKEVTVPEGMIVYVEGSNAAPSMMGAAANPVFNRVQGLVDTSMQQRTLLWLKGIKLEVLDENDNVLPTAEFICHCNIDINPNYRNNVFPQGQRCPIDRLATITQGQTEITFPKGYAVPVASDEPWTVIFQAANRTTDEHRRVKHRCTFYFIKDSNLMYPITALNWYAPWIYVNIDKNQPEADKANCPSCLGLSAGVNAPNNTSNGTFVDRNGRRMSGHWVIPPGIHSYSATINDEMEPGFTSTERKVHAIWSHVHPLCTDLTLYRCEGKERSRVFSVGAKTVTKHGLEIKNIDYWTSTKGVVLPAKVNYELQVTYKNTTKMPQDSMASTGMFFEDPTFVRPDWVLAGKGGYACMVGATNDTDASKSEDTTATVESAPLFDIKTDGPILKEVKTVELNTNAGPIRLRIDPALAPITATQIYRLLTSDVFDGTRIYRYEPNFVLQVALAEDKAVGQGAMKDNCKQLLRRLPLETAAQKPGSLAHRKYVLSMARYEDSLDNGTSSFSILLQDSPHLDQKFTVFGTISEDAATLETMAKIENNWNANKYWITSAKVL